MALCQIREVIHHLQFLTLPTIHVLTLPVIKHIPDGAQPVVVTENAEADTTVMEQVFATIVTVKKHRKYKDTSISV